MSGNQLSNIFLTGEIQVGKTTLLNKIIIDLNLEVCGFRTIPIDLGSDKRVFALKSVNTGVQIPEDAYIYTFDEEGNKRPHLETFDNYGARILRECLQKKARVIIMDELGTFENEAVTFQRYVFQCLDAPALVLGVIKNKESDFLQRIRNRQDVLIINVTVENRKDKYQALKKLLRLYYPSLMTP